MAMDNDVKSKILSNDEKALDQSYKSPINFLGKTRYLGRTNEIVAKEIKFILTDFVELEKCNTREEFEKTKVELLKTIKKTLSKILEPLDDEELEFIGSGELKDILEMIELRSMKRLGIPDDKISELLEKERKAVERELSRKIDSLDDESILDNGDEDEDFQKKKKQG